MSMHVKVATLATLLMASSLARAEKDAEPGPIARADLPRPVVIVSFNGDPTAFNVRMVNGKAVAIDPVVPPMAAHLTLRMTKRDNEDTIVEISSSLPGRIKLDLHLSEDDERYRYTSSCPLDQGKGAYEHWPYYVFWLALSNIRNIDEGLSNCE